MGGKVLKDSLIAIAWMIRADVVGSLLRPRWLLDAREKLERGLIGWSEYKRIEDRAVDWAVELQESIGLDVVTDGEMRRLSFQSQMVESVEGFGRYDINAFLWGEWKGEDGVVKIERPDYIGVEAKLRRKRYLSVEEFVYLRARARKLPKITLPTASLWTNFWEPEKSSKAYPSLAKFLEDVVEILREEVKELIRLGATYIQFDAPHYTAYLDNEARKFYERRGLSLNYAVEVDNSIMEGLSGVLFGLHICRGNQASRWLVEGGYEPIAKTVFGETMAKRLLLEYDDHRSGDFKPLTYVPDDKTVVLGLISTKKPKLESIDTLIGRIHEASRYVPLDRLAISPQCGFASSVIGNRLSMEAQRRKLELVVEVARRVWG